MATPHPSSDRCAAHFVRGISRRRTLYGIETSHAYAKRMAQGIRSPAPPVFNATLMARKVELPRKHGKNESGTHNEQGETHKTQGQLRACQGFVNAPFVIAPVFHAANYTTPLPLRTTSPTPRSGKDSASPLSSVHSVVLIQSEIDQSQIVNQTLNPLPVFSFCLRS